MVGTVKTNTDINTSAGVNPTTTIIAGGFGNSTPLPTGLWADPLDGLYKNDLSGQQLQSGLSPWHVDSSGVVLIALAAATVAAIFAFTHRSR